MAARPPRNQKYRRCLPDVPHQSKNPAGKGSQRGPPSFQRHRHLSVFFIAQ